jgi:hypothetical protein
MKIGNREVVSTQSFIVAKGETVEFSFGVGNQPLNFKVTFIEDAAKEPVSWKVDGITLDMTFSNWMKHGPILATLKKPFKIGIVDGLPFGFQVACTAATEVYQVQMIFMYGGDYDE